MYGLKEILDARARDIAGNICLKKALLAIGTASGFKTTNAIDYAINGIIYTKAAADNVAMLANAGAASQGAGTTRYYQVFLDAAGNFATKMCDVTGSIGTLFNGPAPQSGGTTLAAGLWPSGMTKVAGAGNNTITAITSAFPPQVTSASHGLQTGDIVQFNGIPAGSMQQLNGVAASITKVDANNFTLDNVDATQFQAFSVINAIGGNWAQAAQGLAPVGVIKVVNVTNPFIPGTTALNAAGVTATYTDWLYPGINQRPA